jgi:hypothetical protein
MFTAIIHIVVQTFVDFRAVSTISFVMFVTRTVVKSFVVIAGCIHVTGVVISVVAFIEVFTICSVSNVT